MFGDEPLAYFITWTVYGTFLQGDLRGWRKWKKGSQLPQPRLVEWRLERLKYPVQLLEPLHRKTVEEEIDRLCSYREWKLWTKSARTNHVHAVVTAKSYRGVQVRDQLKANCTRVLRQNSELFLNRPVWTHGGFVECVNTEEELESVFLYVDHAQDHKNLE